MKDVASLGSFAIERNAPMFTPRSSDPKVTEIHPAIEPEPDLEVVRASAFAEGFEEGRRSAELALADERTALARLAESLQALTPEPTNALALLLAEAVDRLVRQIVGSVEIDSDVLIARAEAAAALIREDTEPAKLRVNPDDMPLLEQARLSVDIVTDPSLGPGCLVLETGQGWIEDGPAVRIDRLRAELDRMGASE